MVRSIALLSAALFVVPAGAVAKKAYTSYPCKDATGFTCHRIDVPLDRTGAVPGTLSLRFATETGVPLQKKVLVALAGGPGQPDVAFGPSFADGFAGELANRSIVVVDQRGTGGSRALSCPELQGMDQLAALLPQDAAGCAKRLGPQANSYASIETADDLEAVRQALGVDKLSIYGVSYGTWVAQQYARTHPDHTEKLILDSVVPPGADPWDTAITKSLPRVLRGLCGGKACRGITTDIVGDLTALVRRIQAAPGRHISARVMTPTGGRVTEDLSQTDLLYILVNSDLNTFMQARIPAALHAGARGDFAPIIRLRHDTAGPISPLSEFSSALFVATTCVDNELPFSYADSFDVRAQKAAAALAAIPDADIAPFDHDAIDISSVPQICLHWPNGSFRPESKAPMPDVPVLILSGLADIRTATEGAEELASETPNATIVKLRGSGHDAYDSDYTGCVAEAVHRFMAGRKVGTPCRGKRVGQRPASLAPLSIATTPPVPGLDTARSRILRAAYGALIDASESDLQSYYAGFDDTSGGGLRAGFYESLATATGQMLILHKVEYVPGVRVSGAIVFSESGARGTLRVTAVNGMSGRLVFFGHKLVARINGESLKTTFHHLNQTRFASAGKRRGFAVRFRVP